MRVGQEAGLLQLVHGELGAVIPGVEALGAQVDGVGPIGDGGTRGIEGAGGGEELGDGALWHCGGR